MLVEEKLLYRTNLIRSIGPANKTNRHTTTQMTNIQRSQCWIIGVIIKEFKKFAITTTEYNDYFEKNT